MQDDGFFQKHGIVEHLSGIFDDLPGFIYFVKDTERRYVAYNARLNSIFDSGDDDDVDHILGKRDDDFMPQNLMEEIRRDDLLVLEAGETILNKVELVPRGNGFVDWSTTIKKPLRASNGMICGLVGVTRPFSQGVTSLSKNEELGSALDTIHEMFRENISIADLAKSVHVSQSSFLRKFKDCFSMTPKEYIRHLRVQDACHKIVQTTQGFAEIAYACGFSDQSHFSREFSRIMKESPSSYRKRFRIQ